jgi:hypothetical protein
MSRHPSTAGGGRGSLLPRNPAFTALAVAAAAGLLAGCTIEMITPAAAPIPTETPTPELPLSALLPTVDQRPTRTPSLTPSGTPDPEKPADALQRIFYDPLDDAQSGWNLTHNDAGTVDFSSGMLVFTVNAPYTSLTSALPREIPSDAYIEVTVQTLMCGEGVDTFGIIFRRAGDYSYRYAVTCNGRLRFERFKGFDMDGASVWKDTLGLLPGAPAENRISVLVRQNIFRFFVGGVEVFTGQDPMSPAGGIGLFIRTEKSGSLSVGFDNLSVYTITES